MKKLLIASTLLLILFMCMSCGTGNKVEFQTVILPVYGYSDYCNLKTLHIASLERPRHVEFSFDDKDLVILAKGQDGRFITSDFKYVYYAILYVKYGFGVKKLSITKDKGYYYMNHKKYDSAQALIDKILKLK